MSENTLKMRLQQKRDYEVNWIKAGNNNFIPLDGEVIIYKAEQDVDGSDPVTREEFQLYKDLLEDTGRYSSEDSYTLITYDRIKIGNGRTNIKDLPFQSNLGDLEEKLDANGWVSNGAENGWTFNKEDGTSTSINADRIVVEGKDGGGYPMSTTFTKDGITTYLSEAPEGMQYSTIKYPSAAGGTTETIATIENVEKRLNGWTFSKSGASAPGDGDNKISLSEEGLIFTDESSGDTTTITHESIKNIAYTDIAKKSELGTMANESADDYATTVELDKKLDANGWVSNSNKTGWHVPDDTGTSYTKPNIAELDASGIKFNYDNGTDSGETGSLSRQSVVFQTYSSDGSRDSASYGIDGITLGETDYNKLTGAVRITKEGIVLEHYDYGDAIIHFPAHNNYEAGTVTNRTLATETYVDEEILRIETYLNNKLNTIQFSTSDAGKFVTVGSDGSLVATSITVGGAY